MASVVPAVGLQLLLIPASGAIIARAACTAVGIGYPVFASFKTIEEKNPVVQQKQTSQWLTYWTIYGSLSVVESFADKLLCWFPYYYHVKFVFLLWLQLPSFQGARRLYDEVLRPFLLEHRESIDSILSQLNVVQVGFDKFGIGLRKSFGRVKYIEWFLRHPDNSASDDTTLDLR